MLVVTCLNQASTILLTQVSKILAVCRTLEHLVETLNLFKDKLSLYTSLNLDFRTNFNFMKVLQAKSLNKMQALEKFSMMQTLNGDND